MQLKFKKKKKLNRLWPGADPGGGGGGGVG